MLSLTCERSRIRQDYSLGRRQQVSAIRLLSERPTSKPETHKFWLFSAFLVCVVCLVSAHQAFGQETTGTISGTVQDAQGGVVAGATVNVRNLDTNLKRSQVTESDGRFRFLGLAI